MARNKRVYAALPYFIDFEAGRSFREAQERHQYIVTLSGRGEIELAGGRRIPLEPGSVIFAEDSTGKSHISRTFGTEDRIALNIVRHVFDRYRA